NSARVYRTQTVEPIGPAISPPVAKGGFVRVHPNECAISGNGRWLAFFDSDVGMVRLYDAQWGDNLLQVPLPPHLNPPTDGPKSPISRLWFSRDGARVNFAVEGRAFSIAVPRFAVPSEASGPLVRLLTGHRIDATDGIERIDPGTFLADPATYRRAV